MVLHDPQEFGGLEEYATTLTIGLQHLGHEISVLTTTAISPNNQYYARLRANGVPFVQAPGWLSRLASHGPTKLRVAAALMRLLTPVTLALSCLLMAARSCSWRQASTSAYGWLHDQMMRRIIGPDRRQPLTRGLLTWWRARWRPDLIHVQGYTNTLLFVIEWAHAKGVPVVYEEHQTPDPQFRGWENFQLSINKADLVVAVSERSAEALRTVCGVTRPIVVRDNMVADPVASGFSLETGISPGDAQTSAPISVTTVARLYVTKGLSYLLEAIAQVRTRHPNARFRVHGDGELRAELLDRARRLGLDGNEIFVGSFRHQDLACIMSSTDIFVLPSILEGQPLTVVEAMAYGRPIVATMVGGIPEVIKDGINGLLCPPKDPACLAEKISRLIEDPELRRRLAHAARLSYEQGPFQTEAVCSRFVSIYSKVLRRESLTMA